MIIELQSDSATAKINTLGAELISFIDVFGTEYMWQKDEKYWGKCSPILFPIVGNLKNNTIKIKGEKFNIPKHGFCKLREFKVMYKSKNKVILTNTFDEDTLKVYPYKFSLTLTYSLIGGHIEISYTVLNLDEQPIDFCLGAHPAFNVPVGNDKYGNFEDYCLEFNKNEGTCTVYDTEKLEFNPDKQVDLTKGTNKIQLKYSLFDNDAFVFDTINSDSVKLKSNKTGRGVQFDFTGFDSIAFWTPTKKDAPFLCLEPWNGMAVRTGEDDDFAHKYSAKHLDINEQFSCKISIIPM